jgi:predicted ATPase
MKIKVKQLGILREAEWELGNLTIVCGANNTGKTYATYALYGFLKIWKHMMDIALDEIVISDLCDKGLARIDLAAIWRNKSHIIDEACLKYSNVLFKILASSEERMRGASFSITTNGSNDWTVKKFTKTLENKSFGSIKFVKEENSNTLEVVILKEGDKITEIPTEFIKDIVKDQIEDILFQKLFPEVFIASAERTGAAIFLKELDFARNRILDELSTEKPLNPYSYLDKVYTTYAMPVKDNVDFIRQLDDVSKHESDILKNNPDILDNFADIIGGQYKVSKNSVYFVPHKMSTTKLTMNESSSAVRSLLDIGFYIRHSVKAGDLLMIDEPELNLHPGNQRRIARLFARLVNAGVKVFITTHSDYIIKELNILILLHAKKGRFAKLIDEYKYTESELLDYKSVKVYEAGHSLHKAEGATRSSSINTFTQADINPEYGIELKSFDKEIREMNHIQNDILLGAD